MLALMRSARARQARLVERRVLRLDLPDPRAPAQGRGAPARRTRARTVDDAARPPQTPQGQMLNNFISGSVGGFVGTALNTPCAFSVSHVLYSADAPRRAAQIRRTHPRLSRHAHANARARTPRRSSSRASRAPRRCPAWRQSTSGRTRRSRPSRARRASRRSTRASCRRCSGSGPEAECCCWSWRRRWLGSGSVSLLRFGGAVGFRGVLISGQCSGRRTSRRGEERQRVRMSLRMRRSASSLALTRSRYRRETREHERARTWSALAVTSHCRHMTAGRGAAAPTTGIRTAHFLSRVSSPQVAIIPPGDHGGQLVRMQPLTAASARPGGTSRWSTRALRRRSSPGSLRRVLVKSPCVDCDLCGTGNTLGTTTEKRHDRLHSSVGDSRPVSCLSLMVSVGLDARHTSSNARFVGLHWSLCEHDSYGSFQSSVHLRDLFDGPADLADSFSIPHECGIAVPRSASSQNWEVSALTDIGTDILFIRRLRPGLVVRPSAPWTRLHRSVHDGPVPWS
jgi:hypothetical protein